MCEYFSPSADWREASTHRRGLRRRGVFLDRRGTFCFCGRFGLQNVRLDHLQVPVLGGDVAVLERNQDGAPVFPGEPLLRLQSGIGARRVGIQVVLEQVGLGETGHGEDEEERWDGSADRGRANVPSVGPS